MIDYRFVDCSCFDYDDIYYCVFSVRYFLQTQHVQIALVYYFDWSGCFLGFYYLSFFDSFCRFSCRFLICDFLVKLFYIFSLQKTAKDFNLDYFKYHENNKMNKNILRNMPGFKVLTLLK